tara:strand:- start:1266 stop:1796 length:531 start_codon:yes stop_codon:yes gene_type:complete
MVFGYVIGAILLLILLTLIFKKWTKSFNLMWWNFLRKKSIIRVNSKFKLIPNEKIIIPMFSCYIVGKSPLSYNYFPRDVIVTNKRILIGFYTWPFLESFGNVNLWYESVKSPKSKKINKKVIRWMGGDSHIKKIYLNNDKKMGSNIKIELDYAKGIFSLTVYTKNAKKIYEIISKK